ncbi:peptidase C39 family protein [Marinobacterium litorale]|uniref:peptidase C39 family protein n=1 Tax=Marinobacterium litorale TaxID=404770 RepID=UPI00040CAE91|nr:peptidase C39 family protein [Marinobacterium litorale]
MNTLLIRAAQREDLNALCDLEQSCFSGDRLSRRSLSHMLRSEHAELLVADSGAELAGYALVLYRSGTNLARLYSIAIRPQWRGKGVSGALLDSAERSARARECAFMRLEVSVNNTAAVRLYERSGFHRFGRISAYYEDGSDAWRMEKTIRRQATGPTPKTRYYEQTTPFTCGPACLLMALGRLDPEREMSRTEELRIWREATTVYMTSGHGGCSPHGLALSAWRRGVDVSLFVTPSGTPFIDSVRDPEKKTVIELVHADYLAELEETDVALNERELPPVELLAALADGAVGITLISTWRLNRNRAPHWVMITGADERYIYISDPDFEREPWHSETDYIDVPLTHEEYRAMARFGRSRLQATLLLSNRKKKPA